MVVSLIFIVLLRFLAGIMVWVMMIMVILVILYGKLSLLSNISNREKESIVTSEQKAVCYQIKAEKATNQTVFVPHSIFSDPLIGLLEQ